MKGIDNITLLLLTVWNKSRNLTRTINYILTIMTALLG